MTLDDLSDEDLTQRLLIQEIRRLDDDVRKERRARNEILARYEQTVTDKRQLETRVALLEAELKRARVVGMTHDSVTVQIGRPP